MGTSDAKHRGSPPKSFQFQLRIDVVTGFDRLQGRSKSRCLDGAQGASE